MSAPRLPGKRLPHLCRHKQVRTWRGRRFRLPSLILESQAQRHLDQARLVELCAHNAELRRPERRARIAEQHPVRDIEDLGAELQLQFVFRSEAGVLEQGEIEIIDTFRPYVRQGARSVAERERRGLAEVGRVEPLVEPAYRGAAADVRILAVDVRPRRAGESVRQILRRRNEEREAALQGQHAIEAPSGYQLSRYAF